MKDPGTWCRSDHAIRGDVGEARRLSLSVSQGFRLSRSLGPTGVTSWLFRLCVPVACCCLVVSPPPNPTSARKKDLQIQAFLISSTRIELAEQAGKLFAPLLTLPIRELVWTVDSMPARIPFTPCQCRCLFLVFSSSLGKH